MVPGRRLGLYYRLVDWVYILDLLQLVADWSESSVPYGSCWVPRMRALACVPCALFPPLCVLPPARSQKGGTSVLRQDRKMLVGLGLHGTVRLSGQAVLPVSRAQHAHAQTCTRIPTHVHTLPHLSHA